MLRAKDLMTSDVVSAGPRSTVNEVADLLMSHGIGVLPVIDGDRLIGIVSEGDLVHRAEIGTAPRHRFWWLRIFAKNASMAKKYIRSHSTHVTDIMTAPVLTVAEDTSVSEIADLLERRRIKHVPVVRGHRVVGIVSRADLVRALAAAGHMKLTPTPRHDGDIHQDILDALRHEHWASSETPNITVTDGIVTLRGTYQSEEQRKALHILAENIDGVRGIDDHRALFDFASGLV